MRYSKILAKLKELDSGLTDERYCTHYLCMSKHYLSMIKSRRTEISASATLRLYKRLEYLASAWNEIAKSSNSRVSSRARKKAAHYTETAELVLSFLLE